MKTLLGIIISVFCFFNAFGQYTSVNNGNWTNPLTWSPTGVAGIPLPGSTVTINHNVTLNTPFAYTNGSITISTNGSLVHDAAGRDISVSGTGTLTNNGTLEFRYLLLNNTSVFTNSGTANIASFANYATINNSGNLQQLDSLYNDGTLTNTGLIRTATFYNNNILNNYSELRGLTTTIDSITNAGTMLNDVNAIVVADSALNLGTFTNNGILDFSRYTNQGTFTNNNYLSFYDMLNWGTLINTDSIIGSHSVWNMTSFDNQSTGYIYLAKSFLNGDASLGTNAVFIANGTFELGDSWYNTDSTKGTTGSITMQDSSVNTGVMSGSFDFCDYTPPPSSPYVDFNLGTISPSVTFCVLSGVEDVQQISAVNIYPNPTTGLLNLEGIEEESQVQVFNAQGQLLEAKTILPNTLQQIDLNRFSTGVYWINLSSKSTQQTIKILKQ
ncbi:MAG: T9SS type A sorting domain-containing protein [Aureispira sp.]|nr:T9SS type A sorting domain-containing protein [Aureispira sp.]